MAAYVLNSGDVRKESPADSAVRRHPWDSVAVLGLLPGSNRLTVGGDIGGSPACTYRRYGDTQSTLLPFRVSLYLYLRWTFVPAPFPMRQVLGD
jgi:hypothetical protein